MEMLDAQTKTLVRPLEDAYAKLPMLPVGVKEFIVKIAPWLSLILGVLAVLGFAFGLLGVGLLAAVAPLGVAGRVSLSGLLIIPTVLGLVAGVMYLLAFQPLKVRKLRGWNLMFWITVLGLVSSLVSSSLVYFSAFSIVWAVLWWLVGLYFLFQVKSYYK